MSFGMSTKPHLFEDFDEHRFPENVDSSKISKFLVNCSIPVEITSMPDAVLNTPFGKLIEAQLSNFQINPN